MQSSTRWVGEWGRLERRVRHIRGAEGSCLLIRVRIQRVATFASSPWHRHTQLSEYIVALTRGLTLQHCDPVQGIELRPLRLVRVAARCPHRLRNRSGFTGYYLLLQLGEYDFVRG